MRPNHAYPPGLKTILKAGPVIVVFTAFGVLFPTMLYNVVYHPHERVPKYHYRSNKFERTVRSRDEKLRSYYLEAINWQPNQSE